MFTSKVQKLSYLCFAETSFKLGSLKHLSQTSDNVYSTLEMFLRHLLHLL